MAIVEKIRITNGRCSEPTSRPSIVERDVGVAAAAPETRAEHRGPVRHLLGRFQYVVFHEDVVVEDESVVLHEECDAGVLGPHGEDHPAAVSRAITRASRSQLRPPIPAAAGGGMGLSGGR